MEDAHTTPDFRLFGGPLHRLGRRLGLVRGDDTVRLGLALGLLTWGVLVALASSQGMTGAVFSLDAVGAHVRFLVAVPLFFLCETWVGPRMAEFVRDLASSGVVPESERMELTAAIRRVDRLKDPWLAEILFLLAVVAMVLAEPFTNLPGRTGSLQKLLAESGGRMGPALAWYLCFGLPLFRFLLLRWLWHLGLWFYFLWRVQGLKLELTPTHPDRAGGLGYLEVVQEHFTPLVVAISAVLSSSFAEGIAGGTLSFETLYRLVPVALLLVAVLFLSPLLIFSEKLWRCRITGWSEYMGMASRYVSGFDRKWIRGSPPVDESLLGTPDMQSLADLGNSVNVVRHVQWVPGSRRLVIGLASAAVLPLLPLLLLKYPVGHLATQLFRTLTGL